MGWCWCVYQPRTITCAVRWNSPSAPRMLRASLWPSHGALAARQGHGLANTEGKQKRGCKVSEAKSAEATRQRIVGATKECEASRSAANLLAQLEESFFSVVFLESEKMMEWAAEQAREMKLHRNSLPWYTRCTLAWFGFQEGSARHRGELQEVTDGNWPRFDEHVSRSHRRSKTQSLDDKRVHEMQLGIYKNAEVRLGSLKGAGRRAEAGLHIWVLSELEGHLILT